MMKRFLFLCFALILTATSCSGLFDLLDNGVDGKSHPKAVLTINNQSSCDLFKVKYAGEGGSYKNITRGSTLKIELKEDRAKSFLFFEVHTNIGTKQLRTNEMIHMEKGVHKTFTINDNTIVAVLPQGEAMPLKNIINASPSTLTIRNKTEVNIYSLRFKDKRVSSLSPTSETYMRFDSPVKGFLHFTIHTLNNDRIDVRTSDELNVNDDVSSYDLTNETLVVKNGLSEPRTIGSIIGYSELKIVNNTSTPLHSLEFAGKEYSLLNRDESWMLNSRLSLSGRISFTLKNENLDIRLITKEAIQINEGEKKEFILTDNTVVINTQTGSESSIGSVLNECTLSIVNNLNFKISSVSYGEKKEDYILSGSSFTFTLSASHSSYLFFTIPAFSHGIEKDINVKTQEVISVSPRINKTYELNYETIVINTETGEALSIAKALGISTLKIKNESSVTLSNLEYKGKTHSSLFKNNEWVIVFENTITPSISDHISFQFKGYKTFSLKTASAISILKGETKTFSINDTMRVTVEGYSENVRLENLINKGLLTITNSSSADIKNLSLKSTFITPLLAKGETASFEIKAMEGYVSFQVSAYEELLIFLADKYSLEKGSSLSFTISDSSYVIKTIGSVPLPLKKILKQSLLTLKNESGSEIKNIKIGNERKSSLYNGDEWKVEVNNTPFNDYIYFDLEGYKTFQVKTKEKLAIGECVKENITLSKATEVILLGTNETFTINDLKNSSLLIFKNDTSERLYDITLNENNLGNIGAGETKNIIYKSVSPVPCNISFKIIEKSTSNKVTVKPFTPIVLQAGKQTEYTLTNDSFVLKELSGEKVSVSTLLGISYLKIINEISVPISNLSFSDKRCQKLYNGESWSIELENSVTDFISFNLPKKLNNGFFELKLSEKISLSGGENKIITINPASSVTRKSRIETISLSSLLNPPSLKISNQTSAYLYDVTLKDSVHNVNYSLGTMYSNTSKIFYFDDPFTSCIHFRVQARNPNNNYNYFINLKTYVSKYIGYSQETFIIDNNTWVEKEDGTRIRLGSLFLKEE